MAKMTTDELLGVFEEMTVLELKGRQQGFQQKYRTTSANKNFARDCPYF